MIRNCLLILFLSISATISFSQNYQDQFILSAAVGGQSSHINEDGAKLQNTFNYRFNVKMGYFITKRSSIGIFSGFSLRKNTNVYGDTLEIDFIDREYYIGPYYKVYLRLIKRLNFTMFASVNYRHSIIKSTFESSQPTIENSYNLTFIPGLSYDITDRLSVNLDMGEFTAYV